MGCEVGAALCAAVCGDEEQRRELTKNPNSQCYPGIPRTFIVPLCFKRCNGCVGVVTVV